jgi:hypothetical protein
MNQAVQTIRTYQTAVGPTLEAHVSDPAFGDVKLIVTGRAGEVIQAQLVVRDRVAADAISAAAARIHASGDALAGVSLTVRAETGTGTGTGAGSSGAFEAAAWGSGGYGAGAGPGGGHASPDGQASTSTTSGNPSGGFFSGNAPSGDGSSSAGASGASRDLQIQPAVRAGVAASTVTADRLPLGRVPGSSSLDVRA